MPTSSSDVQRVVLLPSGPGGDNDPAYLAVTQMTRFSLSWPYACGR